MRMHFSRILTSSGLLLLLALGVALPIQANVLNQVKLVATVGGQPALQEAYWVIYNTSNPYAPAATLPRHTGTVLLPAGNYRATISLNNKSKETLFRVETETSSEIRVAMD